MFGKSISLWSKRKLIWKWDEGIVGLVSMKPGVDDFLANMRIYN